MVTHDHIPESDEPHQPVNLETFFGQKKAVLRSFHFQFLSVYERTGVYKQGAGR